MTMTPYDIDKRTGLPRAPKHHHIRVNIRTDRDGSSPELTVSLEVSFPFSMFKSSYLSAFTRLYSGGWPSDTPVVPYTDEQIKAEIIRGAENVILLHHDGVSAKQRETAAKVAAKAKYGKFAGKYPPKKLEN